MVERDKLLDIDFLKKNHTRLYYFGLGFIQLVLNKEERIHFYPKVIKATNDEIHNHRYNFKSEILKGTLYEERYKLVSGDSHILINESCNPNAKLENKISIPIGVELIDANAWEEGDIYDIHFNEFHSVNTEEDTITYLKRSDIILDNAQVIYEKNKIITCPFENSIEGKRLWEIIEEVINS